MVGIPWVLAETQYGTRDGDKNLQGPAIGTNVSSRTSVTPL